MSAFDVLAGFYAAWCDAAAVCAANGPFYVELSAAADGPVLELGVGDGRIAVSAAARGARVIGVDSSPAMLARCRANAEAAGVLDRRTLLEADFRDFVAPEPAAVATIPFHTIGALLTEDDRRRVLGRVREALAPGGRLVFDHFVFDAELAARYERVPTLRAEYRDAETGRDVLVWSTTTYDRDARRLELFAWTEALDERGIVAEKRYCRVPLAWLDPAEVRALLEGAGYQVEDLRGGFNGEPFTEQSSEQVWFARRA